MSIRDALNHAEMNVVQGERNLSRSYRLGDQATHDEIAGTKQSQFRSGFTTDLTIEGVGIGTFENNSACVVACFQ
jgi:hypothetical protein